VRATDVAARATAADAGPAPITSTLVTLLL